MHQFKLLTITLITVREFKINDSEAVAEKIAKLLRKIWSIATKRIDEIEWIWYKNLANYSPPKTLELMTKLKHIHTNCIQTVMEEMNTLRLGDSLAMFVQQQDCAIIPTTENWNNVWNLIEATFPGSLNSSEFLESDEDIEVILFRFVKKFSMRELNENAWLEIKLDCLSKWLISLLMADESRIATAPEFPVLQKRYVAKHCVVMIKRSSFDEHAHTCVLGRCFNTVNIQMVLKHWRIL